MMKFHLNDKFVEDSKCAVFLDFYDIFEKIKIEVLNEDENFDNIKIKLNEIYVYIKMFNFKKRENKKSRYIKK